MDRESWQGRLEELEPAIGLTDGFKFLYCPWATLDRARVAFVSLNPGLPPPGADLRCVSDERGCSYEIEQGVTLSPITDQYLSMCRFIGVAPSDVLAGVAFPFRSGRWCDLTSEQMEYGLRVGEEFWSSALTRGKLALVIVCSSEAASLIVRLTSAELLRVTAAGWGSQVIRVFRSASGVRVVHLPHLSRFRLFGRVASEMALKDALISHGM